ncbi:DUF4214 domain-containing protein [Massilia sp. LjRoot122]|uniref:DUF4214 domain-containing protein n=1 Tax=Massilia sp. LjRoot122 TaxID=3342257 RepID=UPI003ED0100E
MTDKTQPTLINFKLPNVIDLSLPGAKITFGLEATDGPDGSGIGTVQIEIDRFISGGVLRKHVIWSPDRTSADGQIVSTDNFADSTPTTAANDFNVGAGTPTGTVTITRISISDLAGNFKWYTTADLAAMGFNTTISLVNAAAPAAPTASLVSSGADASSSVRTFAGASAAGTTVYVSTYSNGKWIDLGKTTAGVDGKWTLQSTALSDGVYNKTSAWAVDAAGNASALSTQFSFDIWKDGLAAPTLSLPVHAPNLLRVDNPVISGTGVPKALVTLFADGKVAGTGRVNDNGTWSILTDNLTEGSHTFTASQSTDGGRTSPATQAVQAIVAVQPTTGLKFVVSSLTSSVSNADRTFIQNMLDDTAARFSEVLDANQTIAVAVNVRDLGNASASAGAAYMGTDASGMPLMPSAVFNLNSNQPANYAKSEAAPAFLYAHEMLHVLGINAGTAAFSAHVRQQADGIFFVGPNAMAINGGPVRLDSSRSHLDGNDDLMGSNGGLHDSHAFSAANPYAPFSALDLAILKDIGWTTKPVLVSDDGHTFVAGSGKAGFDQVDGTAGLDTFFISQNRGSLSGAWVGGEYVLSNAADGTAHSLSGIERVQFADKMVALDVNGVGGQVYRLYQAVFGRTPDSAGLGFWIDAADNGQSIAQIADQFAASNEFKTLYGVAPSPDEIVTKLYANVLHRAPDQGGYDYWLPIIKSNPSLVEEVLVAFSESAENKEQVAKVIGNGFEYEPWG